MGSIGQRPATDVSTITRVDLWPIDIPLTDPFVVATGQKLNAQNIFVRVTLQSGAHGYGEIAPFPEVGGEGRSCCEEIAPQLAKVMLGQPATHYKRLARLFHDIAPAHPATRCGLETALLDALCRTLRVPLWGLWGGADVRDRDTDMTIPITDLDRTIVLTRRWYSRGFRLIKTKVGANVDDDIRRLDALHRLFPDVAYITDANQGFTQEECRFFVKEVKRYGANVVLLEQPLPRDDLEGVAALRRDTGLPVAADESVRSLQDAKEIVKKRAADFINIKIMKSGVLEAIDIAAYARASGLRLMIGGMVESRIAMGCSFAMVLGFGGFEILDLDTPLLLATDPVKGGYHYSGPTLHASQEPGLDVKTLPVKPVTTIE